MVGLGGTVICRPSRNGHQWARDRVRPIGVSDVLFLRLSPQVDPGIRARKREELIQSFCQKLIGLQRKAKAASAAVGVGARLACAAFAKLAGNKSGSPYVAMAAHG